LLIYWCVFTACRCRFVAQLPYLHLNHDLPALRNPIVIFFYQICNIIIGSLLNTNVFPALEQGA
jgi:hypothetical protein